MGDGFVMDWVTDYAPEAPNHWLREAMERGLVPVVRVQHCQRMDRGDCAPSVGYSVNVATQILDWKVQNPQYANRYVYMALWNEPGDVRDYMPMEEYADFLESHLEAWTVTTQGSLVTGSSRHYIRILPVDLNDPCPLEDPNAGLLTIANIPPGKPYQCPARDIVDAGFLELVRSIKGRHILYTYYTNRFSFK